MSYSKNYLLEKAIEIAKAYAKSESKPISVDILLESVYKKLLKLNSESDDGQTND